MEIKGFPVSKPVSEWNTKRLKEKRSAPLMQSQRKLKPELISILSLAKFTLRAAVFSLSSVCISSYTCSKAGIFKSVTTRDNLYWFISDINPLNRVKYLSKKRKKMWGGRVESNPSLILLNFNLTFIYHGSLFRLKGFPVLKRFRIRIFPQCTLHVLLGQHAKLNPVFPRG